MKNTIYKFITIMCCVFAMAFFFSIMFGCIALRSDCAKKSRDAAYRCLRGEADPYACYEESMVAKRVCEDYKASQEAEGE